LIVSVIIAGSVITLRYSGYCRLHQVIPDDSVNGGDLDIFQPFMERNLFDVPLDAAADQLLADRRVFRVDLDYRLPSKIKVKYNETEPLALVAADGGQALFLIDRNSHIIPDVSVDFSLAVPVITGIEEKALKTKSVRLRLTTLAEELARIKEDFTDFYLAIANIAITSDNCVIVYLDGLPFGIKAYTGALYSGIRRLKLFLLDYNPELNDIKLLDMRSENQIVAVS
jgi:hypothetical protein